MHVSINLFLEKKKNKKQKSEEATGDLIGNEITDNITRALKTSPQNSSQKIESKTEMTVMSRTSFRVNLHSKVCLNVKELLAPSRRHI